MIRNRLPRRGSIKESLDHLPSGICFFDEDGRLMLCNLIMHRLAFEITGRDLQSLSELTSALEALPKNSTALRDGDNFILPDGSVWSFQITPITDHNNLSFTQIVASDITDLYQTAVKLAQSNREQAELAKHYENITKNVAAIMHEETILEMRMQIHHEVGSSVLNLRRYYTENQNAKQKAELLRNMRNTVRLLMDGVGKEVKTDGYSELMKVASVLGIAIEITGKIPRDTPSARVTYAAIRECLTNIARHTNGDKMFVTIKTADSGITVLITNDGEPPKKKITEGGGLSALRCRIEKEGGEMKIQSLPVFMLTVELLPKGDDSYD